MHTALLFCSLLLVIGVSADDFETVTKSNYLSGDATLELDVSNGYKEVQVVVTYFLNRYSNNTTNFTVPVDFSTNVYDPVTGQNFTIAETNMTSVGNTTFMFSPCDLGLLNNGSVFHAVARSFTKAYIYNITLQISLLETSLGTGRTLDATFPLCPKFRYLSMNIPQDGHGYNITLFTEDLLLQTGFTSIYLSLGDCPSTASYSFMLENISALSGDDGYTFANLKEGGRWWLMLQCYNSTGLKWDLKAKEAQTCLVGCLDRGYCDGNAPEPFCICDYFHTGDDCSELYGGDYSLMAVAALTVLVLGFYIGTKLRTRCRHHHSLKLRPLPIVVNNHHEEKLPLMS